MHIIVQSFKSKRFEITSVFNPKQFKGTRKYLLNCVAFGAFTSNKSSKIATCMFSCYKIFLLDFLGYHWHSERHLRSSVYVPVLLYE